MLPSPWDPAWAAAAPLASAQTSQLTHVLDLDGGADALWSGYSSNVRRSIRRAQSSGLQVRRDPTGALWPVFDRLYRQSVQRWAQTAGRSRTVAGLHSRLSEPASRLRRVSAGLGPGCVVWAAFVDGEPAAAIVVLSSRTHALYWRGAMDRELAGRTHANALLHHLAITDALHRGQRHYSFGPSDEGSDLAVYKAKFGATPIRSAAYHLERLPITAALATARQGYRAASGRLAALVNRGEK
jgi:lipid II:glycine glycyltransferase (peptidoglycan interpeptide bridge formation enzyme)